MNCLNFIGLKYGGWERGREKETDRDREREGGKERGGRERERERERERDIVNYYNFFAKQTSFQLKMNKKKSHH
jgi:hypothetical protein